MLENAVGRLLTGARWGVGAGLAVTLTGEGTQGLRSVARGVIRGDLVVADEVHSRIGETREGIDDLRAELPVEQSAARASLRSDGRGG